MAKIPQFELDRLNAEVSLERLAEARGVKLIRKGADLHGRCPWHADRTPSLVITPEKNLWRCFGACDEGGDVIAWVMKAEGVSFRHAVELLREGLPSLAADSGEPRPVVKASTVRKLGKLADSSLADQELLHRVVSYYHETLKATPDALAYLQGRGLTDPELLTRFKLGFSNRTLGYKLPASNRKEGKEIRGRLRDLGILRETGHEHFRGSVVVPLYDAEGKLVQMYGRKIRTDLRKGTPDHLYLPGPQRGVFNLAGIQASEEVILCESLIDAMTFWSAGIRNVTTAFGVGGLTPDLWDAFHVHGTKRVLIAFDRDKAGDEGAKKLAEKLTAAGIAAYRLQFPRGQDVNEYASKVTPAGKSLALVIRNALWMGEGQEPEGQSHQMGLDGLDLDLEEVLEVGLTERPEPEATVDEDPDSPYVGLDLDPELLETASEEAPRAASKEEARVPERAAGTVEVPPAAAYRIPQTPPSATLLVEGLDHWASFGDRRYRVRDLLKNTASTLKVQLRVTREGVPSTCSGLHFDVLDLCRDRERTHFAKRAAHELGLTEAAVAQDLAKLFLLLEEERDRHILKKLEPKEAKVEISEPDRQEAMDLLKDPRLLDTILLDFARCGVIGEEVNKLVGYLAASSRKLEAPLGVVIQSNSAAGKSSLMDAVIAFMPKEECVVYSAMTGQSLFYMQESDLSHKILAIAEEEGAQKASYALKLLQSEGELTIASTTKDPTTGEQVTKDYEVKGPVMVFLTTTATETDEELLNRCLILTVDEGREQTRAIHKLQRERQTLDGMLMTQEREEILRRHQNAQRLLKPLLVANPYATGLTFQDHQTRMRRDHMKYLTLIRSIALIHQYQREVKVATTSTGREVEYIEVIEEDIRIANRLAREVLGRSLDELPPQTRRLLDQVVALVEAGCKAQGIPREEYRFTRREVRDHSGMGNTQVQEHLRRLEDMEYLLVHAGSRGKSMVYELVYEGAPGQSLPLLPGLLELGEPVRSYDSNLSGSEGHLSGKMSEFSGSNRPQISGKSGGVGPLPETPESLSGKGLEASSRRRKSAFSGIAYIREESSRSSYPHRVIPSDEAEDEDTPEPLQAVGE
jgi:DNA primase catalytic core